MPSAMPTTFDCKLTAGVSKMLQCDGNIASILWLEDAMWLGASLLDRPVTLPCFFVGSGVFEQC
jgi:hypothetical protein